MKKFFAIIALGMVLTCSAFATQLGSEKYPIYPGSITDPGVKVVEVQGTNTLVEINGQFYIIVKS